MRQAARAAFVSILGIAGVIAVLIVSLLTLVEPRHAVKPLAAAIVARAGSDDLIVYEGALDYTPSLPFYARRRILLVNGAVGYFEFASRLPESRGLFLDVPEFVRLWQGPRRVFLVIREPRARSVVTVLPRERVHEIGRPTGGFGALALFSNR